LIQVGHATGLEDLDGAAGEATLRKLRVALHEEHHTVALHQGVNALLNVAHGLTSHLEVFDDRFISGLSGARRGGGK